MCDYAPSAENKQVNFEFFIAVRLILYEVMATQKRPDQELLKGTKKKKTFYVLNAAWCAT